MAASSQPVLPGRVLRSPGGAVALRFEARPFWVGCVLVFVLLALAIVGVGTGEYPLSPAEVVRTLLGGGDRSSEFIVETLRLPRVLCALLVGGALGLAGAIFQSLTRNPLGSPDVVGFTSGSAAGAVAVITLIGASGGAATSVGAVGGGLVTAALVLALAYRHGIQGYRLVLVGIGVGLLLRAITDWLLTRARYEDAQAAVVWIIGSLNGRGWEQVRPLALALALLVPLALLLGRTLRALELGDETAQALGVPVERGRVALVVVGVALTAVATAAAGPIAFVALTAPQLARRLTRASGPGLLPALLMGAVLLEASDCAAQRIWPEQGLPVGIVTGVLGGVYLSWLLASEWRRRSG
ncbi:FecCD family ABC transporter permease [Conexibacter woesei]|uniref:Transport system permease protein n=1 Tax=Conexibacter woesei (strain DSM 14684 / CCUG 47730 / CIP 108061 / JCM 11494 / NBRC 100937 / ID131577) TaxID=469383 RepID=D3F9P7_CONWI|nr:iron chelate uptake ABC transporter family permease subunit [Conexibacter woesei]ADB51109.1 transport system permease protein [Conexibacter woesei DSM 14684]